MFVTNYIKYFNERIRSSIFDLSCRLHQSENPLFVNYFHTDIYIDVCPHTRDGTEYSLPPGLRLDGLEQGQAMRVAALVRQYDSVFSRDPLDVGWCDLILHEIMVVDASPVNTAYRRIPPHMVAEVMQLLQGLLDQGLISRSSSNYASAVVLVKKKTGSLHLCIDYCQLNAKCLKDAFPLPRIDESLEAMSGACLFSSLDLAHGYFQVMMHPESVAKTAFRVPWFFLMNLPECLRA